jgi:glyoxylase-like metal-dependent hydrolase (beta-lactamase superfamily II)
MRALTPHLWYLQSPTYQTNTGIVITGTRACLIDPGIVPAELDAIDAFVSARGAEVRTIILTHAHWDHLLGPERFPDAVVVAHARYREVVARHRADLVRQVARWRAASALSPGAFTPPAPTLTFTARLVLHDNGGRMVITAAPGHAPDHCVVYLPEEQVLWAGDMLSDREIPMAMDGVASYRATLDRLAALDIAVLVPGHGSPALARNAIRARFDQDRRYLAALEVCVRKAVDQGATLSETVAACAGLPFAQPDDYPNAPRWNIEQAFVELGGAPPEDVVAPLGWGKDWL